MAITLITYFLWFIIFTIGLLIGRITMAIQMEVMKRDAADPSNN